MTPGARGSDKRTADAYLPDPEVLARYNSVVPDGAERLFRLLEQQVAHRLQVETDAAELNRYVVRTDAARANLGLAAGFVIAIAFLFCGVYLIMHGHDAAGTTIATVDLVALVGVFIYGSTTRKAERLEKAVVQPRDSKKIAPVDDTAKVKD